VVEADEVVPPPESRSTTAAAADSTALQYTSSQGQYSDEQERQSHWDAFRRSKFFRVAIRDKRTGVTKLETRIPAGFIGGVTQLIPQVRFNLHLRADFICYAGHEIAVGGACVTELFWDHSGASCIFI
jgi:hypothetical protein